MKSLFLLINDLNDMKTAYNHERGKDIKPVQKISANRDIYIFYSGRRTNRETEMLKLRLQNPEPLNRDDDLALSRRQGRDMATIRHWKSELRTFRALPPPRKNLNFTESCVEQNSEKQKGCDIYCKVKEPYITCPSCNTFTWHKSCIQRICTEFSLDIPTFTTKIWKCPNC